MLKKIIFLLSFFAVCTSTMQAAADPETTTLDLVSVVAWRSDSQAVAVGTERGIIHWWILENGDWVYNNSISTLPIKTCTRCKRIIPIEKLSWQSPNFLNLKGGSKFNISKKEIIKAHASSKKMCDCQQKEQIQLQLESKNKRFKLSYRRETGLFVESI